MEEDGATTGMELLSLQEEPAGLNRDKLRRIRKRKGAPKWVRKPSKMVETTAKDNAEEVPMGVIAQEMWGVIMEMDKDEEGSQEKETTRTGEEGKSKSESQEAGEEGAEAPKTGETKEGEAGRHDLIRQLQLV